MTANITQQYTVTGIAVMVAWGESYQVFGSLNSSPWTSENFGADPEKAASCRRYVKMAVINNALMGGLGSWLTKSPLPLVATTIVSGFMYYLYENALKRGAVAGSKEWANPPEQNLHFNNASTTYGGY
jgi:hypothetical protein